MPFDGITVSAVTAELNKKILNGRIDKISQPENDELVLSIRSQSGGYKLLLSANASAPRLCLTEESRDNPMTAPLFCMVLRKHLKSGRILSIEQPGFERMVVFTVESLNEMGFASKKRLIIEIMGKHSNIILIDENGTVLDSAKRVSFDKSSVREILPGKKYQNPPPQNKLDPMSFEKNVFVELIKNNGGVKLQNIIYQNYTGISPTAASEICFRAGLDASAYCAEQDEASLKRLVIQFERLFHDISKRCFEPHIYFDEGGALFDFSAFKMHQYSRLAERKFDDMSELLSEYYAQRDTFNRVQQKSQDLRRFIKSNLERLVKKNDLMQKAIAELETREQNRVYGELIRANLYNIEPGVKSVELDNYFEQDCRKVTIPLNPDKTPKENMQSFFKLYNKQKRAYAALETQMAEAADELSYFESLLVAIANCSGEADIENIRLELYEQGFLKKKKNIAEKRQKRSEPLKYKSTDGFEILVGKNNTQNDELTLKISHPTDMWLHTKNIPGSHVIIRLDGKKLSDAAVLEAAKLAAYHSRSQGETQTPVDYCVRKNVKKPSGAKPGKVIYDNYKTIYTGCNKNEAEALRKH